MYTTTSVAYVPVIWNLSYYNTCVHSTVSRNWPFYLVLLSVAAGGLVLAVTTTYQEYRLLALSQAK